jgi:DNA-binding MurR/RpiR family transcriptional regulator
MGFGTPGVAERPTGTVRAQIARFQNDLTDGQRKVADLTLRDPEAIAFGTTASVAQASGTSGPTVVRFAMRLGYSGFTDLQDALRAEVAAWARSAVGRAKQSREQVDGLPEIGEMAQRNARRTIEQLSRPDFDRLIELLGDPSRRLWVLPSTQLFGPGQYLCDTLRALRDDVTLVHGTQVRTVAELATLKPGDIVLTLDIQRHEQAMLRLQHRAVQHGAVPVVLTDQLPCSYDITGGLAFTFAVETASALESLVGLVTLFDAVLGRLAAATADQLGKRLTWLESSWTDSGDVFYG